MKELAFKKIGPDWDASTPLYIQLANNLRRLIFDGKMATGDALPSERMLTELTGASRVTVRKAIDQLIDEGLLLRRQGAGTFVAPAIEQSGEDLTGFTADARSRGASPASIWLVKSTATPTEDEARNLRIGQSQQVVRLGRVRLSDGEPLAIEHAVVPVSLLPDPSQVGDSLYQALAKNGNRPVAGTQKLRASLATPTEAALLSIQENSEILRIERHTYLKDGTPVEYTRSAYRGDRYVFVTELHEVGD
ncbi:MAG: GntR family transcriptional regulator [Alphaproteobacteria bacterium]|nr:MAG: GntR family transcriptional regulator [Alphaproteobacteria bacterium]